MASNEALQVCLSRFDLSVEDLNEMYKHTENLIKEDCTKLADFFRWLSRHFKLIAGENVDEDKKYLNCRQIVFSGICRIVRQQSRIQFLQTIYDELQSSENPKRTARHLRDISWVVERKMVKLSGRKIKNGEEDEIREGVKFCYIISLFLLKLSRRLSRIDRKSENRNEVLAITNFMIGWLLAN